MGKGSGSLSVARDFSQRRQPWGHRGVGEKLFSSPAFVTFQISWISSFISLNHRFPIFKIISFLLKESANSQPYERSPPWEEPQCHCQGQGPWSSPRPERLSGQVTGTSLSTSWSPTLFISKGGQERHLRMASLTKKKKRFIKALSKEPGLQRASVSASY